MQIRLVCVTDLCSGRMGVVLAGKGGGMPSHVGECELFPAMPFVPFAGNCRLIDPFECAFATCVNLKAEPGTDNYCLFMCRP